MAVLVAEEIDPCEAHLLQAAAGGIPDHEFRDNRGWSAKEWHDATDRLAERGVLRDGTLTDTGTALPVMSNDAPTTWRPTPTHRSAPRSSTTCCAGSGRWHGSSCAPVPSRSRTPWGWPPSLGPALRDPRARALAPGAPRRTDQRVTRHVGATAGCATARHRPGVASPRVRARRLRPALGAIRGNDGKSPCARLGWHRSARTHPTVHDACACPQVRPRPIGAVGPNVQRCPPTGRVRGFTTSLGGVRDLGLWPGRPAAPTMGR